MRSFRKRRSCFLFAAYRDLVGEDLIPYAKQGFRHYGHLADLRLHMVGDDVGVPWPGDGVRNPLGVVVDNGSLRVLVFFDVDGLWLFQRAPVGPKAS